MRKYSITNFLGIIGGVAWTGTFLLRELALNNETINFILGIIPNIAAVWLFLFCIELVFQKKNLEFNMKIASSCTLVIFIFSIISEIIHDKFLNSPFDMYDIIGTIGAIVIYLICFYLSKNENRIA